MAPAAAFVPWPDLPKEIWAAIGMCLDSHMDVLRFRSVCTTWRFLIPTTSLPSAPRLPISVPFLDGARVGSVSVFQSTIYSLHPSLDDPSSSSPGWLVTIEQQSASDHGSESGSTVQLLNPLTDRPIKFDSGTFPNPVNLLNYRVTEVCKEYKLRHTEGRRHAEGRRKVLLSPNSPWTDVEEIVIVGLFHRKLRLWKYGQKSWKVIKGAGQLRFEDIIHYRGQFYAVDDLGTVYWIDSAMGAVQFSPPMCGCGDWKHLVEFNGDLCVVDQYLKVCICPQLV